MKRRNRTFQVFSLAFLDCICCGFGAMILIFVLTLGKSPERNASVLSKIQETISRISAEIVSQGKATADAERALNARKKELEADETKRDFKRTSVLELQHELSLLLAERSALKEELGKLLGEKKALPTREKPAPIPLPNAGRRQYLSGFNFEGKNMVLLIEASGGMIGYTVDEALSRVNLPPEEKRATEKWRRVVRSVQWVLANLGEAQEYQIVTFNREPQVLLPDKETEWLQPLNRDTTTAVLHKLADLTPQYGANLEKALKFVKDRFPLVDGIVLVTDSLPTLSDTYPTGSTTDDRDRERFFRAAMTEAPKGVPINTLLFPMSGDPACPYLFWQLADATRGALISPAASWPDL